MKIQESAENYLETIYVLSKRNGTVRSIDIANELGFTKASVSVAMKNLREEEYVITDADGTLNLTQKGLDVAERVYERHEIIAGALMALGVDQETAYADSCKIEHHISAASVEKIKQHLVSKNIFKVKKSDE